MKDHLIHRQKLHIKLSDQNNMFQVRELVHRELEEKILPGLDLLFSELVPDDDTVYQVERLQVDIGKINFSAFEREFSERVLQKLQVQLKEAFLAGAAVVKVTTAEGVLFDALLHYLQYGFIPWWYKPPGGTHTPELLFQQEILQPGSALRIFAELHSPSARRRFLQLAGVAAEALVAGAVKQNWPILTAELQELLQHKNQLRYTFGTGEATFQEALLAIVHFFLTDRQAAAGAEAGAFCKRFLKLLAAQASGVEHILKADLAQDQGNSWLKQALGQMQKELLQQKAGRPATREKEDADPELMPEMLKHGILVPNAGLILLHPFLPQLFKTLGFTNEKGIFPEETQAKKAAVVLQYLVTGKAQGIAEYDLVLNKIICGLAVEELLNTDEFPLTAAEEDACEEMLAAVIAYWEALRNTSNSGLREGFLMRNGKVRFDGGAIQLHVERKTQDVLLEKLPWGLSIVKFPFLKSLIYVEW